MLRQIVFRKDQWDALRAKLLHDKKEASMYALTGFSSTTRRERTLVRELVPLAEADYDRRSEHSIRVKPAFINRVAQRCEADGLGLLITHSHPFEEGDVWFSPTDDAGEERVLSVFNDIGASAWPLTSLVLAPKTVKARVWKFDGGSVSTEAVHQIVILGDTIEVIQTVDSPHALSSQHDAIHARQVLAFGAEGQRRLLDATFAVIGAGGTGSACAEMVARLGAGRIHLVDPDILDESNLSRVFGSTKLDVGAPKVKILSEWIGKISSARSVPHASTVDLALDALLDADVILACTDTESSRAYANQVCYQYMIPLIEIGNRIDASNGRLTAASTRMTVVGPGKPCLECYGTIDHFRLTAELMPNEEYAQRRHEGYVADLDTPNPSVVSLNAFVASQAITRVLDLICHIGGPTWNKWTYNYLDGELRPATVRKREKCVCTHYEAYGDLKDITMKTGVQ